MMPKRCSVDAQMMVVYDLDGWKDDLDLWKDDFNRGKDDLDVRRMNDAYRWKDDLDR